MASRGSARPRRPATTRRCGCADGGGPARRPLIVRVFVDWLLPRPVAIRGLAPEPAVGRRLGGWRCGPRAGRFGRRRRTAPGDQEGRRLDVGAQAAFRRPTGARIVVLVRIQVVVRSAGGGPRAPPAAAAAAPAAPVQGGGAFQSRDRPGAGGGSGVAAGPPAATLAASRRAQSWKVGQAGKEGDRQYACWWARARGAGRISAKQRWRGSGRSDRRSRSSSSATNGQATGASANGG